MIAPAVDRSPADPRRRARGRSSQAASSAIVFERVYGVQIRVVGIAPVEPRCQTPSAGGVIDRDGRPRPTRSGRCRGTPASRLAAQHAQCPVACRERSARSRVTTAEAGEERRTRRGSTKSHPATAVRPSDRRQAEVGDGERRADRRSCDLGRFQREPLDHVAVKSLARVADGRCAPTYPRSRSKVVTMRPAAEIPRSTGDQDGGACRFHRRQVHRPSA